MRNFIMIAVVAITMPFLDVPSASAEGLNGGQIKKLLIGNTLYRNTIVNGQGLEVWVYFKNETKRKIKRVFEARGGHWRTVERERSWSITADGKYCIQTSRGSVPYKVCRSNLRVVGDIVKMDGVDGVGVWFQRLLRSVGCGYGDGSCFDALVSSGANLASPCRTTISADVLHRSANVFVQLFDERGKGVLRVGSWSIGRERGSGIVRAGPLDGYRHVGYCR